VELADCKLGDGLEWDWAVELVNFGNIVAESVVILCFGDDLHESRMAKLWLGLNLEISLTGNRPAITVSPASESTAYITNTSPK